MLKPGADYIEYGILGTDGSKDHVGGMLINYCGDYPILITLKYPDDPVNATVEINDTL